MFQNNNATIGKNSNKGQKIITNKYWSRYVKYWKVYTKIPCYIMQGESPFDLTCKFPNKV